ncbi:recombinase family protein [Haloechinothrix salitolerans]
MSDAGLSDYAISPFAMPASLLRDEVRVAFLGRTSTEDQQDPRQSLMRQLGNCKAALPESWVIAAHFYDVESGRMELDLRGRGVNYERFGIPISREGGIAELLTEAAEPGRRFDVVICEGIARVARRAFEGISIERELERAEVPLFAANEPITLTGSTAQRILQRRINQSIAEYEVLNTLEQSWGGLCTHVREGWNIGKPPYGYRAKTFRHPNPTKANKGLTKSRLEPDGVRGETVTQIAQWRYYEGVGYSVIADRLNCDPEQYPPPEPTRAERARGAWAKSAVYEILRNPKYTGHQVFNRRATSSKQGKVNDPVKWLWSAEPAHEPLIPKWMFDEINTNSTANEGSRPGGRPNRHPATKRSYRLRSMVFCGCGRRMIGDRRRDVIYYLCWPPKNNRGRPWHSLGHTNALRIREDELLDEVCAFYAERVFGPDRRALLLADIPAADDQATREREAQCKRLQRTLADITRRQDAILRQAQTGDPDDPFTKALRSTYNDLESQKAASSAAITKLSENNNRHQITDDDLAVLDALPFLEANLAHAPERTQRRLFELTRLNIRMNPDDFTEITLEITLPADQLSQVAQLTTTLPKRSETKTPSPSPSDGDPRGCGLYPRWDSNPRYRRERPAS